MYSEEEIKKIKENHMKELEQIMKNINADEEYIQYTMKVYGFDRYEAMLAISMGW